MKFNNTTIGIWGFGRVGKSAASFFQQHNARVVIYDDNPQVLASSPYLTAPCLEALLHTADYILPSPGIDTRPYRALYQGIWLCEVDIFQTYFKKPVIAITGSVGKTTITHILAKLLQYHGLRALAAGNIGIAMLDVIGKQYELDIIVLELSSFQLEFATIFAPELAILTNLYPNHLDRHATMDDYFAAKLPIAKHQSIGQYALVPYHLQQQFTAHHLASSLSFFTAACPQKTIAQPLYCVDMHKKEFHCHHTQKSIALDAFSSITFPENWLIIWAALDILGIAYQHHAPAIALDALEHRLEKVAEINGAVFYNDSKSTTPTSTLAAIEQFKDKHIVLFLGGLNKGIDRTPLIQALKGYHVHILSFGKEAAAIKKLCDTFSIPAHDFANLEDAFHASTQLIHRDDCVLFSPSGSSYDLFRDYQERGNVFKKLVMEHKKNCS